MRRVGVLVGWAVLASCSQQTQQEAFDACNSCNVVDSGRHNVVRADGGAHTDAAPTPLDGGSITPDAAAVPDAARPDATPTDAGLRDAAPPPDAALPHDAAAPPDANVSVDATTPESFPDATVRDASSGSADANLGWPLDAAIPQGCPVNPPDTSGTAWSGWGNFQYPATTTTTEGTPSPLVFGQVWRDGETNQPGVASGWEAEVAVGPLGALPTTDGRCWKYQDAEYNVDVGNNDEYRVAVTPSGVGLYGLYFRYRPSGGAWRYGDLNGSDDGIQVDQAARFVVTGAVDRALVVATVNLHCRTDAWTTRLPLIVSALARISPDLVAFQEDCSQGSGVAQSVEVRAELASVVGRGYEVLRVLTHQANHDGQTYDEGISLMSAFPVEASHVLDLPYATFPRKAMVADVRVNTTLVRFYATHWEYGTENDAAREGSAQAILADVPSGRVTFVAGDFNTAPTAQAVATMRASMTDVWAAANPSSAGLTFPASNPTRRIDYVFMTPDGTVRGARILDERNGATLMSDHRGVAVAAELP
ncbi:MAG: endonuclease/exonuclease/phosphatase family protein [Myxococcota bacterium]